MVVSLLTKYDMENGGTGAPSVVTPGLRWIFRGYISTEGGVPTSGQFKVNGGALTTYNIGSIIGSNDNPSVDITASPFGSYVFEYNIEECDLGSRLTLSNATCPTCNAGTASDITVCNGACTVDLFTKLSGGADAGGSWSQVSGPSTLTFTNGGTGTVNFSGKTAGAYVVRYTVQTCSVDMNITVQAPPNAGADKTVSICDNGGSVNFGNEIPGAGNWILVGTPPVFGTINFGTKIFTAQWGDGGNTYEAFVPYVFRKTVEATGIVPECATACNDSADLTVNVYHHFDAGQSAGANNVSCNDGSQRSLRDLLVGETPGGRWEFFGGFNDPTGVKTFVVNGSNQTLDPLNNKIVNGGDNPTLGFPTSLPADQYAFRYIVPSGNQNATCSTIKLVLFNVQQCTNCNGNLPTINKNISGNCVNATRGGSLASTIISEVWTYRTSSTGSFVSYTPGTNVCALPYVEFRYVLTLSGGCPNIERSTIHTQANPTCSNSPTVTASFGSCQFTISPGGSNVSPVGSDSIQWRYQGNANWFQYTGPITITGSQTIEYRRIVSYADGCPSITTATQQISGQCATSCNISIGVNGSNNLLTATTNGCGSLGQSINWYYSSNGTTYGGVIGTGFTYTPTSNGYYKAVLTCGTCTDEDIYQFTSAPPPCSGSVSISNSNGVLTANRTGCAGSVTYDWQFSATGTGWGSATGNTNGQTLTTQNGPGFYRVFTFCNGSCMLTDTIEITGSNCNNNPTVNCNFNTSTCQYTLTPGGTVSNVADDAIYWKPQGTLNVTQYSGPFVHNGAIEFQRAVTFFGNCPNITTAWTPCSGTCCNGNTIDVNCSFNQTTCQYTLIPVTNVTNTITSDLILWRPDTSSAWNIYGGPFTHNGNIIYRRVVSLSGGCGQIQTPDKTCTGSCCTGNNPTVTATFNSTTCLYTISGGGTNTSAISTDILEWRPQGSGGGYTMYTAPFTGPSSIEVRRRVTYSDGCTATVPGSASGSCCNGNNPGATCNYSNTTCQYTLSNTGSNTSPVSTDIIRWRPVGSGIWNTYTGAFSNNGQIEYQRVVTYSNGCPDFLGTIQTCNGSCCSTNNPDATCNFSGTNCTYTLTKTGTVNNAASDTLQYRTLGSGGAWTTYSGPFTNPGGSIEYRRVVTFSDGCTSITTTAKPCQCCANSNIGVSHSFNSATCIHTITLTGTSTVAIQSDITEWRQLGTNNAWTVYSGPFTGPSQIEIRRNVVYVDNCTATATGTGTGVCCNGNTPDVTCSKDANTCTITLIPQGTNASPASTDVIEWREIGGGWNVYSSPIVNHPANIEYRRTVTYSNGCPTVATAIKTCSGTCCNSAPTVSCSFNTTNCQYTLTAGGTVNNVSTDVIEWRQQGSGTWNTYTGPFASSGVIEYRRTVTYTNGCTTSVTGVLTCSGTCCTGNNPGVTCNFNTTTCQYTLSNTGTNTSPVATDVIEWRPIGVNTWNTYSGPFVYNGQIEFRRSVVYSNSCGSVVTTPQTCSGTCCTLSNPDVTCAFDTQTCLYTLTKTGTVQSTNTDIVYWRQVGSGSWNVYSAAFANAGQIEFYRAVTFSNGCAAINTATKQCSGTCCGSNNPGISCSFNTTNCEYTLSNTGTNVSTVTNDVKEWRAAGSTGAWTTYTVPFTGPANIEARRVVSYSNCSAVTATTTCGGACCNGNAPTVSCSFNPVSCTHTLTPGGANTSPVANDVIQWRVQGSGGAWNTYSSPISFSGNIEYRRVVTYSNGCAGVTTTVQTCGGQCCSDNNGDVTCSFNTTDCKYTLTKTGVLVNVTNDIVQWRPATGGSWTTYTVPFVHSGAIEFRRTATSTNSCPNYDTGIKTCSGDCCTTFNVTTSLVSNQLQASTTGCSGTATILWYYGSTAGTINTFVGSGTTISPANGAGYYEARGSCSAGNCQDNSVIQYVCTGTASSLTANINLSVLTLNGLSGCINPSYLWEYSSNGSTNWIVASGANSASNTLSMSNGNGYYRVTVTCDGLCPFKLSYQRNCTCSSHTISASITKISDTVLQGNVSGCSGGTSYNWAVYDQGGQIISGQGTSQITTNGRGRYILTASCNNACGTSCSSQTVPFALCTCSIIAQITADPGCNTLRAISTGCNGSSTYSWSANGGGAITGSTTGQIIQTNGKGGYNVTIICNDCGSGLCQDVGSYSYINACNALADLSASGLTVSFNAVCPGASISWEKSANGSSWTAFSPVGGLSGSFDAYQYITGGIAYFRYSLTCSCGTCIKSNVISVTCACSGVYGMSATIQKSGNTLSIGTAGCPLGTISYFWTATNGGSIVSGQNTSSITTNGVGTYTVQKTCHLSCGVACGWISQPFAYLTICSNINTLTGGGQGQFNQIFTANGTGTLKLYFTPQILPDRFIFRKNGTIVYDSGCCTMLAEGYNPSTVFECADITFYQPTGATFIPKYTSENPFFQHPSTEELDCWRVNIPVNINDQVTIQIVGGCTGCIPLDPGTAWNFYAVCE